MHQRITAFLKTLYHAHIDRCDYLIRIGQPPPDPIAGFTWALVIADNPLSKRHTAEHNHTLRYQLQHQLDILELPYWPAVAIARPRHSWPDEHGFLARLDRPAAVTEHLSLSENIDEVPEKPDSTHFHQAITLARKCRQHAIVVFQTHWQAPQLLAVSKDMQAYLLQHPMPHCLTTDEPL